MQIGKRIRQLRKDKHLSLTELSKKSGVQIATLSRIENLKMTGTIESHMGIARALGVDVTELYQQVDSQPESLVVHTQPARTDVFVHNDQSSYEILTSHILRKKMMPVLLKIEPGGETTEEQNQPGTEKFVFVLEGKVIIQAGDQGLSLSKNNTLYFDASQKHKIMNDGQTTAKVISVVTPVAL